MATCEWNEAVKAAVFKDDEGRIVLAVLARPDDYLIATWEAQYPHLNVRQGVEDCFPGE